MGKLAQSTIKYLVEASFEADGLVEKPDIIGAIFGQTEGLLGQDLDLRELQRTGRIGRIEVDVRERSGKTVGVISIPSSLDASETVLIAAAIETIERIGPCESRIKMKKVKDIRAVKRDYVMDRAKEIMTKLLDDQVPQTSELSEKIKTSVRVAEIENYEGLPAGPDIEKSSEVIFVEGRADVLNLLKYGIKNAIAVGGAKIAVEPISKLSQRKTVTVFLDGDRGGEIILRELKQVASLNYFCRAPDGKEVEELTSKEIYKALRDKRPIEHMESNNGNNQNRYQRNTRQRTIRTNVKPEIKEVKKEIDEKSKQKISGILDKMVGTKAAYVFDISMKLKSRVPLNKFDERNKSLRNADIVLIDEKINDDIVKVAESNNIKYLVADKSTKKYKDLSLKVLTKKDLK